MKVEKSDIKNDNILEENKNNEYQNTHSQIISNNNLHNNDSEQFPIKNDEESKPFFKKKYILIIGIIIFIFIIIAVVFLCIIKKNKNNEEIIDQSNDIPDENLNSTPINPVYKEESHIGADFYLILDDKDLKRIFVEQNYEEIVIIEGIKTIMNVNRKTIYDLFVFSHEKPDEDKKNLYDKKYSIAMLVNSQCVSTENKDCVPNKMIDFTNTENIQNFWNILDKFPDLNNLSIPLCKFELTDNDVITSITCPENIQKNIKENMVLDLYFYRPPAIINPDKNSNITFDKYEKDNKYYIRKTNGGICDIVDSFFLFALLILIYQQI